MPSWPKFKATTPPPTPHWEDQQPVNRSRPAASDAAYAPGPSRRGPPIPTSYNTLPSSASSPPTTNQHTRSSSQTLPGMFRNNRKNSVPYDSRPSPQGLPEVFETESISPRKMGSMKRREDGDTTTGRCATCSTKLNHPRGVLQFRCAACIMVNDLESKPMRDIGQDTITVEETKKIIDRCVAAYLRAQNILQNSPVVGMPPRRPSNSNRPRPPQPLQAQGRAAGPGPGQPPPSRQHSFPFRSPPPLNGPFGQSSQPPNAQGLSRPPLNVYPSAGPRAVSGNATGAPQAPQTSQQNAAPPGLASHRSPPRAGPGPIKMPVRSASMGMQNTGTPSPQIFHSPREEADSFFEDPGLEYAAAKAIFKPLEDYIIRTFGTYDNLNRAFLSGRPRLRAASSNVSNSSAIPARPAAVTLPPTTLVETAISEVDAKTLLLGNIGENALWWTGEEENLEASKTRPSQALPKANDLVNIKSPRINREEVNAWYKLVLLAGLDWETQLPDPANITQNTRSATTEAFAQARGHVHKTVLKVSEGLLRRPGRPLKTPPNARFLLILLANPLLYPTIVSPLSAQIAESTNAPPLVNQDGSTMQSSANKRRVAGIWEQGNAFGNVKRLLGLLSNLSNDCHRHLLAWVSRYDETQFKELVGLIQAFMNHRLERGHSRKRSNSNTPASASMIPGLGDTNAATSAVLHSALGLKPQVKPADKDAGFPAYSIDWQIKAAARIMSLLFSANQTYNGERTSPLDAQDLDPNAISRRNIKHHGQLMSISDFYNSSIDRADMVADFDMWESARDRFAFCQYPFFLSIGSKIRIMEHDAKRQMDLKEREAFFDSILRNRVTERHCTLKVRRDCLADDSLRGISEVVGQGADEIKKGLRIQFVGEEGVDAGGLRKEWFLLLVREIFDTRYGLFVHDDESPFCYFNPRSFETSDHYFLMGALLGLAIYNSAILDIALPPFVFKKLLAAGPTTSSTQAPTPFNRASLQYTLDDLAEIRPGLARGLRHLLAYPGNVEDLSLDFIAEVDNYDTKEQIPLSRDSKVRPVTNANRAEFVSLYTRYLLGTSVSRQFEPFKRGFFTVCSGNALSLFQPEEIELLVRGSDERLDVSALKAVAVYDNWRRGPVPVADPLKEVNLIQWFWEFFEDMDPKSQRRILGFITGSDRIPALGAASLVIKIGYAGKDYRRFPIARTCFNLLLLYKYRSKMELAEKVWRAVSESEGFGLK